MVLLVTWGLWKEWNQQTFDHKSRTPAQLIAMILDEADAWLGAGYGSLPLLTAQVN